MLKLRRAIVLDAEVPTRDGSSDGRGHALFGPQAKAHCAGVELPMRTRMERTLRPSYRLFNRPMMASESSRS